MSAWNKQEGGNHYKGMAIQPMEFALKNGLDYAQANVIKYVCRHATKNGKQDLLKAIHNIELMIEHYYGAENAPETPQETLIVESGKHSGTEEKCDTAQKASCEFRLATSLGALIHGTCHCGEAWQPIISEKEGFSRLHCFNCGSDRYENNEDFGCVKWEPKKTECEYDCKCYKRRQLVSFNPKTGKCHSCGGVVSGWESKK